MPLVELAHRVRDDLFDYNILPSLFCFGRKSIHRVRCVDDKGDTPLHALFGFVDGSDQDKPVFALMGRAHNELRRIEWLIHLFQSRADVAANIDLYQTNACGESIIDRLEAYCNRQPASIPQYESNPTRRRRARYITSARIPNPTRAMAHKVIHSWQVALSTSIRTHLHQYLIPDVANVCVEYLIGLSEEQKRKAGQMRKDGEEEKQANGEVEMEEKGAEYGSTSQSSTLSDLD